MDGRTTGTEAEAARHRRAEALFHELRTLPVPQRAAHAAGRESDERVLDLVRALLEADVTPHALDRPPLPGFDPDPVRDLVPETIGAYRVLSRLGEGGMGVVYEAEESRPRRVVALKVLRSPHAELRRRFDREAQALASIDHPGIARVWAAGDGDVAVGGVVVARLPYIAMELVRGAPITAHAAARGLPIEARVELWTRVCDAVEAAHAAGVVHCDLKPSNVLVNAETGEPRVLDFGVARIVAEGQAGHTTALGPLVGTLAYMSPEQAAGRRGALDARSDVYALGVVLYELLTGRLPIDVSDLGFAAAARLVEEAEPVRADLVEPRLRGDLTVILAKALEKDPARRYRSAGELAADLRRHLRHEPIAARPSGPYERALKAARRHRTPVVAVAAALVSALIALSIGVARAMHERDQAVAAGRRAALSESKALAAQQEAEEIARLLIGALLATDPARMGRDVKLARFVEEVDAQLAARADRHSVVDARLRLAIGHTWQSLGELARARRNVEAVLETRRRELGAEHVDTAYAEAELASLEIAEGRPADAEARLRRVLDHFRAQLGVDHAYYDETRMRLVGALIDQGRPREAEPLAVETLEHRRRVKGADAAETLDAEMTLAGIWTSLGLLAEARPLLERGLESFVRSKGFDHPWTIAMAQALAALESRAGDHELAEALQSRATEASARVNGERHPVTLLARRTLAGFRWEVGQVERAIEDTRAVLADTEAVLGARHPDAITARGNLGSMLLAEERAADAEPILARAADDALGLEGMPASTAAHLATRHGVALIALERLAEAEARLLSAWDVLRGAGAAPDSPGARETARQLARICAATGRTDEERDWRARAKKPGPSD